MNKMVLCLLAGFMTVVLLSAMTSKETRTDEGMSVSVPQELDAVFQTSCFDCHNVNSKNEDGKDALLLDRLDDYTKRKLLGKLSDIKDVVKEGDMPPSKYLDKKPEAALSEQQKEMIYDWADKSIDTILER